LHPNEKKKITGDHCYEGSTGIGIEESEICNPAPLKGEAIFYYYHTWLSNRD